MFAENARHQRARHSPISIPSFGIPLFSLTTSGFTQTIITAFEQRTLGHFEGEKGKN